jgi:hypothetical protein
VHYYDRHGQPITLDQWLALVGDLEGKRVAQDDVVTPAGRCLWISTVWLGLDHNYGPTGPPVIFETMTFERGMDGVDCQRYATEAQALAGHQALVHAALEGLLDERTDAPWPQD